MDFNIIMYVCITHIHCVCVYIYTHIQIYCIHIYFPIMEGEHDVTEHASIWSPVLKSLLCKFLESPFSHF